MAKFSSDAIRNICLLGHGGDGKTSIAEAMLYLAKATDRLGRIADGNTVCDFDPEEIKASIQKIIPDFEMDYDVDPVRQSIAESWPNSLDVSCAQEEWGFSPKYDLDAMTKDMLEKLKEKLVETV